MVFYRKSTKYGFANGLVGLGKIPFEIKTHEGPLMMDLNWKFTGTRVNKSWQLM